jgi:hypothetical protein
MTENSKHRPQHLRTFASDMQAVRSEHEHSEVPTSEQPVAARKEPIPVAAAPKPTKKIVRENIPEPKIVKPIFREPLTAVKTSPKPVHDTPHGPTKIPAFHELQKSIATIQENIITETIRPERHNHKTRAGQSKDATPVRTNIGYNATVITDTKAERFKFFPSVLISLAGWLKKLTAGRPKKVPKYTIPETERRKGVIQRATTKTGTIFTADSETLKERIRRRQIQDELDDDAETIWTPFTEPGFSLLEAPREEVPTIQNVTVEYKRVPQVIKHTTVPPITATPIVSEIAPMLEDVAEKSFAINEDVLAEARWSGGYEDINQTPEIISEPQSLSSIPSDTERRILPTPVERDKKEVAIQRVGFFSSLDTNTLTVLIIVTIIGIVAVVFITRVVISELNKPAAEEAPIEVPSEPLLTSAKLVGVPLTAKTLNQLPEIINSTIASSSMGLIEYAVVSAIGDEVSAPYLFEILGFHTTPNFRQSLTVTRFASVNHSAPAMILRFVDKDAVRGGLLNWETSMPEDLAKFYTIPAGVIPDFTDEVISGVDVRILRHNEAVVLVYSITESNTAVITSNTTDFAQIVELGLLR